MKKLDLIGQQFGRLTVIESSEPIGERRRSAWVCKCSCAEETIVIVKTDDLRSGDTKSCGCWNNEQRSARAKNMYSKCIKYSHVEASARRVWRTRYREMPFEDFYELSQLHCYYCNEPPSNRQNAAGKFSSEDMKNNGYFTYNGLDRVDNTLPHSKNNCVPCCKYCNFSKRERTTDEFKAWVIRLYNHFIPTGDPQK